jgi:hypothetical protein
MTAPSIVEIHPANEAEGVVLSDQVYVIFDREVDHTTVQIMLEGPDTDRWSGPEQTRWDNPDTDADDDVLATPGYKGMVAGVLAYTKVDGDGVDVSAFDYTGGGVNWRAKVTLTPNEPLAPNTEYRIWIIGDEETGDTILSGVAGRTVFDPVKGANIGDGDVYFTGGYTGTTAENAYVVRIKEAGEASDKLLFEYWRDSAPLVVRELNTSQRSQLLDEGVYVRFEGDFEIDDEFTVQVRTSDRMQSTYTWTFTTGAGSIITIPDSVTQTPSVPVGGFSSTTTSTTTAGFSVLAVTPSSRVTDKDPLTILEATVLFSDDIDEDTITDDTVTVWSEPVNGDPQFDADGVIVKTLSVNGATLTITFTGAGDEDTSQLHNNNMVFIQLDETISSTTEDDTLGSDFTWYFTTTYTPMYSAIRRIRLDLGALIVLVPDDTINLAIFEASLEAQALTFGTPEVRTASMSRFFAFARRQYVTCLAEVILLNAISGGSIIEGGKSKRLADLQISYDGGGQFKSLLDKAMNCLMKWAPTLTSAGEISPGTSQRPSMVIKGILDPDRPEVGRDWQPVSTYSGIEDSYPAANTKSRHSVLSRRWKRSFAINRWGSRFGRYSS